jgi:hypothetical protein
VDAFWAVVNWRVVAERYDAAMRRALRHAGDVAEAQVLAAAALERAAAEAAGEAGGAVGGGEPGGDSEETAAAAAAWASEPGGHVHDARGQGGDGEQEL